MKTKEQVEFEFKSELNDLLKKWNASIKLEDYGGFGWSETRIQVEIDSIWNDEGQEREYTLIEFGSWIDVI